MADGHIYDLIKRKHNKKGIKTRNKEFYNVTFANTERYKNSPIITMQRLLNEDKAPKQKNTQEVEQDSDFYFHSISLIIV